MVEVAVAREVAAVVVTVLVEVVSGKNIRGFRTLQDVSHDDDGNGYDNGDVLNSEAVEWGGGDGDQLTKNEIAPQFLEGWQYQGCEWG